MNSWEGKGGVCRLWMNGKLNWLNIARTIYHKDIYNVKQDKNTNQLSMGITNEKFKYN